MDPISKSKLKLTALQIIVDLELWRGNPPLTEGIFLAYVDIAFRPPLKLKVYGFGSQAYWKEVHELFFAATPYDETDEKPVN